MTEVHVVVPAGIDDPRHPSGGNAYDRRVMGELARAGWNVREHRAPGGWPRPTTRDRATLGRLLAGLPDDATVVVDGLIGSACPEVAAAARRLLVVVLVHMPLAEAYDDAATAAAERAVLRAARAVVTTSVWARQWLARAHGLDGERVHVIVPGTDAAPLATPAAPGNRLLCVGPVTPAKGADVVVAALAELADLDWTCTWVGALDAAPAYVADVVAAARSAGIGDRLRLAGPLTGRALAAIRADTDLMVSASLRESYGMAVTEALACGIPVVATAVGGQPEAVGAVDGEPPGLLVPPGAADRMATALRRWLTDAGLRDRLRRTVVRRRADLPTWPAAVARWAGLLAEVAGEPMGGVRRVSSTEVHR